MIFSNDVLQTLTDIRVDLLHYWSQEENHDFKNTLSNHLNKLDELILAKRKQLERINQDTRGPQNAKRTQVPRY